MVLHNGHHKLFSHQVKLVGGSCAAGAGLSTCQSSLFASAGGGGAAAGGGAGGGGAAAGASGGATSGGAAAGASISARLLVVMMAGKSTDSVTSSASALKQSGIKILCLGMGGNFDKEQMTALASSSEYSVSVASFSELSGFSQQFISLISTGKN